MTDTNTLAPADAEILDAAEDFRSQYTHGGTTFDEFDALDFARAVLAKWGTPQPTHAQTGAVPLTAKQMESGREAIFSTGNPYCPCDSKTFRKVAEWVERHHGIKGSQHAD